jgi:hypothetical protein
VELGTSILDSDFDTYATFTPFLTLLPTLQRLVIAFCNTEFNEAILLHNFYTYHEPSGWGRFDTLVECLISVASTLEHLVIKECAHHCQTFLDFVWPMAPVDHSKACGLLTSLVRPLGRTPEYPSLQSCHQVSNNSPSVLLM